MLKGLFFSGRMSASFQRSVQKSQFPKHTTSENTSIPFPSVFHIGDIWKLGGHVFTSRKVFCTSSFCCVQKSNGFPKTNQISLVEFLYY